jgi:hypothetical protein
MGTALTTALGVLDFREPAEAAALPVLSAGHPSGPASVAVSPL